MSYPFEYVVSQLKKHNVRFDVFCPDKNSATVILPDYNRILGAWPDVQMECPLWINEKFLENPNDKSVVWANPGGHRVWAAPEKEFFISDLNRPFETYKVPKEMDPGTYDYKMESDDSFSFTGRINLYAYKSAVNVPLNYKRNIKFIKNVNLDDILQSKNTAYKCIAYTDEVSLTAVSDFKAGIWSLIQIPWGGEIQLPVNNDATYEDFFGKSDGLVDIKNNILSIKLDKELKQDFKIGLKASSVKDRIFYTRNKNGKSTLIINVFDTDNKAEYIDSPWQQNNVQGSAVQFFYGGNWGFAELETHAPVRKIDNTYRSISKNTVYIIAKI